MAAIELERVSKRFDGGPEVLRDVSLRVPEGAIYGFLGPNGSGKTTTVRIVNGILGASSGSVRVLGRSVEEHGVGIHRVCGVLTETAASYEHLNAEQNLAFFGRLYGMEHAEIAARSDELLNRLGLWDARTRAVKEYSTGMKKRMSLARALLHRPRLLFLDEPTNGLDPEGARNVTHLIQELCQASGVTVFLCTHQLKYAQDICTRYGFIHQGRLLGEGSFEELLAQRGHRPALEIRGGNLPPELRAEQVAPDTFRLPLQDPEQTSAILLRILQAGGRVDEARQVRWDLEELYFKFVEAARAQ